MAVHLQSLLFLRSFVLETHSAILISRCRHQGAQSLRVHNYSHSVCSYCYRMLCFGALGSVGQRSTVGNHCLEHSLKSVSAGVLVLMLLLLFSVPSRWSYQFGLPGPPKTFLRRVCELCAVFKGECDISPLASLPFPVTCHQKKTDLGYIIANSTQPS